MERAYIKFRESEEQRNENSENRDALISVMIKFMPIENPEFIKAIDKVLDWYLEFDEDRIFPTREIGLDVLGEPVLLGPWNKNYGHWKHFTFDLTSYNELYETSEVLPDEFELLWNKFLKKYNIPVT